MSLCSEISDKTLVIGINQKKKKKKTLGKREYGDGRTNQALSARFSDYSAYIANRRHYPLRKLHT